MSDPTTESFQVRIERIYRLAAEGDCGGVMEGLHAEYPYLRHPHHEKRFLANIERGRKREISHVQV